jgi:hypothetical protein
VRVAAMPGLLGERRPTGVMVGVWRCLGSRSRSPGLQPRCRPAGAVRSAGSRSSMAEPQRAAVAEEAAGDGLISLAVARVSGEGEQVPQSGRRSGYSGRLQKGARVKSPAMAGGGRRPASTRRRRRNRLGRGGCE